ncbi:hypothetical protein ACOMHN_048531 [Nucella lapillus]
MATKRGLYKPVQTNVVKNRNRRALAQGRLVAAPVHPAAPPPRLQQGVMREQEDPELTVVPRVIRDDPVATPRRSAPRVSQAQSPVVTPPIHTLDLSDSEGEEPPHTPKVGRQVPVQQVAHVMVLDASLVTGSPYHADEECVTGYERSPATIIRHTSPLLRHERVWQVPVDQVTKAQTSPPRQADAISPLSSTSPPRHRSQRSGGRAKDPYGEGATDDDVVTMVSRSSAQKGLGSAREKQRVTRLAQPSFDESGESDKTNSALRNTEPAVPAPSEVTSDSETCSLFEYVPQSKNRPKSAEASVKSIPPKSSKKKKGERTVPSRYMQSAKSKRAVSAAESADRTIQTKKNVSQRSSANMNNSSLQPSRKKSALTSRPTPHLSSSRSPDRSQNNRSGPQGKTSTPTHDGVPIMTSCDASVINPELSMLSAIDASQLKFGSGSGPSGNHGFQRKEKKEDLPFVQQRLDASYARYLQWLFLDTKASFMLQQQEKDAVRQLCTLWEITEQTRNEKAELEQDLAKLRHMNLLDEQLESQQQCLEPVIRVLRTLETDYSAMARAMDTTRHQIALNGIHLPEDEELYLESLEQGLLESEELLGTLGTLTQSKAPKVTDFSNTCHAVEQAVEGQCSELNRCGELLSAVQSLATHENSLFIQAMQASR